MNVLTNLNLNKNQLQNASIHLLSSAPANPVKGQIYTNSSDNIMYYYDGTEWIPWGSGGVYYGVENTATASATAKTVTCDQPYRLKKGSCIIVKWTTTNTAATASLTLQVNSTTAKPIKYKAENLLEPNILQSGKLYLFCYDNTNYELVGGVFYNTELGTGYATQSNTSSSATVTATLSGYIKSIGGIVSVKFSYTVPASATLNINSQGAANIRYNQANLVAGVIKASDIATFIYDGTYYQLISIDHASERVKQVSISTSGEYPVLLKHTANTSTETDTVNTTNLTSGKAVSINPSTGTITAQHFSGTASAIDTTLDTTNSIYLTGLKSDDLNTIRYDTSASIQGDMLTVAKLNGYVVAGKQVSTTLGDRATAEGYNVESSGNYSHAEGTSTHASGIASHAEGYGTTASGDYSHAEGNLSKALGQAAHAEGASKAYGVYSHAQNKSVALGNNSTAESVAVSYGDWSHAEGRCTKNTNFSISGNANATIYNYTNPGGGLLQTYIGCVVYVAAVDAFATIISVDSTNSKVTLSNTLSSENLPSSTLTIFEGSSIGEYSHSEGYDTLSTGNSSHSEGLGTKSSGLASHAEGEHTYATGDMSHAEGNSSRALGSSSHAEGAGSIAYGSASHAEGVSSGVGTIILTGDANATTYTARDLYLNGVSYSNAPTPDIIGRVLEYNNNKNYAIITDCTYSSTTPYSVTSITLDKTLSTSALSATSVNIVSMAYGQMSHTEGKNTTTSSNLSHAEGDSTLVSGEFSHAEGNTTVASGSYSHAEGVGTVANHKAQHVFGQYNIPDDGAGNKLSWGKYVEIVGNGQSVNTPSNARTLSWLGDEWLSGKITLSLSGHTSDPQTVIVNDGDVVTKKYLEYMIGTLGTILTFKGVKSTISQLPLPSSTPAPVTGDVWIVNETDSEYVYARTPSTVTATGDASSTTYTLSSVLNLSIGDILNYGTVRARIEKIEGNVVTLDKTLSTSALSGATVNITGWEEFGTSTDYEDFVRKSELEQSINSSSPSNNAPSADAVYDYVEGVAGDAFKLLSTRRQIINWSTGTSSYTYTIPTGLTYLTSKVYDVSSVSIDEEIVCDVTHSSPANTITFEVSSTTHPSLKIVIYLIQSASITDLSAISA